MATSGAAEWGGARVRLRSPHSGYVLAVDWARPMWRGCPPAGNAPATDASGLTGLSAAVRRSELEGGQRRKCLYLNVLVLFRSRSASTEWVLVSVL